MIANGTWLTSGAAVVDSHGRIIESNDEFAFWAGTSEFESPILVDLFERKCPGWKEEIEDLLSNAETFHAAFLEDTTADPSQWYKLELTRLNGQYSLRLSRCLPPVQELAEGSWDKFLNEEEPRRELYARTLRAEAQVKLLSGKWPGVLFSQRADYTFSFVSSKIEDWTGISVDAWSRRPQKFWDIVHE